jgi:hypothetical protein
MVEALPPSDYGTTRKRAATVSYAVIEAAARRLMGAGGYPSVAAVRKELKRGSSSTIHDAMQRFWKDQAALNAGNPVALTRLPPEFADAAVGLWEQALRLAQQTALSDDNAARKRLDELKREVDLRVYSVELREKQWDMAARVRERGLAEAREQVSLLMKELAVERAELRGRNARIADLEAQLEEQRRHLATVITRAIAKNSAAAREKPRSTSRAKPKRRVAQKKRSSPQRKQSHPKRKRHG